MRGQHLVGCNSRDGTPSQVLHYMQRLLRPSHAASLQMVFLKQASSMWPPSLWRPAASLGRWSPAPHRAPCIGGALRHCKRRRQVFWVAAWMPILVMCRRGRAGCCCNGPS